MPRRVFAKLEPGAVAIAGVAGAGRGVTMQHAGVAPARTAGCAALARAAATGRAGTADELRAGRADGERLWRMARIRELTAPGAATPDRTRGTGSRHRSRQRDCAPMASAAPCPMRTLPILLENRAEGRVGHTGEVRGAVSVDAGHAPEAHIQ
ncbi:hypothetical protein GCM10027569_65880 [Flindersiella endophytica]